MSLSHDLEPLFPDRSSREPLAWQLARRLRAAIDSGHYPPAMRLLPRRELALRLGLARNTVSAAIDRLIAEGYLESRPGSGTFVAALAIVRPPSAQARPAPDRRRLEADLAGPLRPGTPDLEHFPVAAWARITRRKLSTLTDYLDYGDARGYLPLRRAITQHVGQFRGVVADERRVVIVEGTQAALRVITDVLLVDGDSVVVEDPCYSYARASFSARRLHLVPASVDAEGMSTRDLPPAKLAYVSPSHQFPLGVTMSVERRTALLRWAVAHDAYVIEDDYDSEFGFVGKPLPALQSLDGNDRVIYVGTFSKTLAPGLRLGWLVVPSHLARAFAEARFLSTLGGGGYVQATLADFIDEGYFARYVRRMTRVYDERRRAVLDILSTGLRGCGYTLGPANFGLHVAVIADGAIDDVALAELLLRENIAVQALSTLCLRRTDCRGFVVGFGAAPLTRLVPTLHRFVEILRGARPGADG